MACASRVPRAYSRSPEARVVSSPPVASHSRNLHHRPHFDAAGLGVGNARGDRHRFIEVLGFDQVVATELLARFGKRAVGPNDLSALHANGGRRAARLEWLAAFHVATVLYRLREAHVSIEN